MTSTQKNNRENEHMIATQPLPLNLTLPLNKADLSTPATPQIFIDANDVIGVELVPVMVKTEIFHIPPRYEEPVSDHIFKTNLMCSIFLVVVHMEWLSRQQTLLEKAK